MSVERKKSTAHDSWLALMYKDAARKCSEDHPAALSFAQSAANIYMGLGDATNAAEALEQAASHANASGNAHRAIELTILRDWITYYPDLVQSREQIEQIKNEISTTMRSEQPSYGEVDEQALEISRKHFLSRIKEADRRLRKKDKMYSDIGSAIGMYRSILTEIDYAAHDNTIAPIVEMKKDVQIKMIKAYIQAGDYLLQGNLVGVNEYSKAVTMYSNALDATDKYNPNPGSKSGKFFTLEKEIVKKLLDAHIKAGDNAMSSGSYTEARSWYQKAVPYGERHAIPALTLGAKTAAVNASLAKGRRHLTDGEYKDAIDEFKIAVSDSDKYNLFGLNGISKDMVVNAYTTAAESFVQRNLPMEALDWLLQGLDYAKGNKLTDKVKFIEVEIANLGHNQV